MKLITTAWEYSLRKLPSHKASREGDVFSPPDSGRVSWTGEQRRLGEIVKRSSHGAQTISLPVSRQGGRETFPRPRVYFRSIS